MLDRALQGGEAYPKLNSKRPLYGKLQFARTSPASRKPRSTSCSTSRASRPRPRRRQREEEEKSGEEGAKKPDEKKEGEEARRPRREAPKLSSYDRLYIDANRDGDLTNDPVLKPMKNPPWQSIPARRLLGRGY